jgi:hypothetical protein
VTDSPSEIRRRAVAVLEAGTLLRATSIEERARWLAEAAKAVAQQAITAGQELSEATGLSIPMIAWASRTTLDTIREDTLLALAQKAARDSPRATDPIVMLSVVLAGNVFTASVRGIFVPLFFGIPVLVKASSKDTFFPAMLRNALHQIDADLGSAMSLVAFPGGDVECEAVLVEIAESVSVYGSDDTVAVIAARLRNVPLITHGHGVSVAYCGADALDDARIDETIAGLSLDICAYDQRGCLSPQLVYVEQTPGCSVEDFAERLAIEGLEPMSRRLPRGPLPASVGAEQAQWRGIAEVEGTLIRGDTYALAVRPPQPIRWSPAYRNVTLAPVRGLDEALRAMNQIGSTLKCVGASPGSMSEIQARLSRSQVLEAYASALGTMQTPPLDASADGRPIWHGLFRH